MLTRRLMGSIPLTANWEIRTSADAYLYNDALEICAYGVRLEFHLPPPLLAELPPQFIPGSQVTKLGRADAVLTVRAVQSNEGEVFYEFFENGTLTKIEATLPDAACMVESWAQLTVATLAKDQIFVHAGVVRWRDKAMLLPGRSFAGKSTLVMALIEAGAEYYSDEFAIFDSEGRVHPYWRFPKIRTASGRKVASRVLHGILEAPPPAPIPLGWVLMTRFEGAHGWEPNPLTCGQTLLGLLDNTVPVRNRPEQALRFLAKSVVNAQGFEGPRGEAAAFAEQVLAMF